MNRSSSFTSSIALTMLICSFFSVIQGSNVTPTPKITFKSNQPKKGSFFGGIFNPEETPPASPTGTITTIPCPEPIFPVSSQKAADIDEKTQALVAVAPTEEISDFDEIDLDETKRTMLESLQDLKKEDPFAYVLKLLLKPALFKDQYANDPDMPGLLSKGTSRYAKKIWLDITEHNKETTDLTQKQHRQTHDNLVKLHSTLKAIKQINPHSQEHKIDSSTVRILCETLQETTAAQLKTLAAIITAYHQQYVELKKVETICKQLHPHPQTIHTPEVKVAITDFAEYVVKQFPQTEANPAPTKKVN